MKYYAGIGSRSTPADVLGLMTRLARRLNALGYTLRSGGATGADEAFEQGADGNAEIYLPWRGFRGHSSPRHEPSDEAMALSSEYHPAWSRLKWSSRLLMARNAHQVLGERLTHPAYFVLCWTPDGAESHAERSRATGGTGQAISIAEAHDVFVFNLRNEDALDRLGEHLREVVRLSST